MMILYKSMVRPHLEYGNAIWGPIYMGDLKLIEGVQRRATKLMPHLKDVRGEASSTEFAINGIPTKTRRHDPVFQNHEQLGKVGEGGSFHPNSVKQYSRAQSKSTPPQITQCDESEILFTEVNTKLEQLTQTGYQCSIGGYFQESSG